MLFMLSRCSASELHPSPIAPSSECSSRLVCEILTRMTLACGSSYKMIKSEGGTLRSRNPEDSREWSCPSHRMQTQQEEASMSRKSSSDTVAVASLVVDCLASRTIWNQFLLSLSHPVYGTMSERPENPEVYVI